MPASLVIIAFAGIAVLAVLSFLLGQYRTNTIKSVDQARAILEMDHPGFNDEEVLVASDGHTALLVEPAAPQDAGRVGLILALGDRYVTRILVPGSVRSAAVHGNPPQLVLELADVTLARTELQLPKNADKDRWLEMVTMLIETRQGDRTP